MILSARIAGRNFKSTGISAESIAAMTAILPTASREVYVMPKDDFARERLYQMTMHLVKKMLADGTITKEEYERMDAVFLAKYRPIFGTLFSEIR